MPASDTNRMHDAWEVIIGLEVHAQLSTRSKMYARDAVTYGEPPNTVTSPLTLGHPGTLPRVNRAAIDMAIRMGLATECSIHRFNGFARKNYFYGDLPKGYQITQDTTPICTGGVVRVRTDRGETAIRVQRIHMEEDAGKSMHDIDPYNTLIDLNRAGTPLIEIVTEPDLRTPQEAYAFLQEVRKLVRHLDICDGNMEEGSLRCDANVSVRRRGETALGQKVEVKNMNSMRHVMKAIEFEAARQIEMVDAGEPIEQQTRSFDASDGSTFALRSKEEANDYRYFPEPDLPPVMLTEADIDAVRSAMPELPAAILARYTSELGLSDYDAGILSEDKAFSAFYDEVVHHHDDPKAAANWMIGPVRSWLNDQARPIEDLPVPPATIATVLDLIADGTLNFASATQRLWPRLLDSPDADPADLAAELGIVQDRDTEAIEALVDDVLAEWPEKVAEYRAGKKGLLGLFMGQVMKRSKGSADPKLANELLTRKLHS